MELWQVSATELLAMISKRRISAAEAVQSHLHRIHGSDHQLRCFISLVDDALEQANRIDERLSAGEMLPLAGLPLAVKDNISLAGVRTTCGSRLLSNYVSPYSATVVERLQAAGAVVIGKTNMDEFAMGSSTEFSAHGPTHNPWDRSCVPGGSSGGSAAALAAGMVPVALGSDTGGSIRQPASLCGVVGLRPTYGRISRHGLVAMASSLDQIGPLARTVSDIALVMKIMTGFDPRDATSVRSTVPDYVSLLTTDLRGIKLGILRECLDLAANPLVGRTIRKALNCFVSLGAEVEECSISGLTEGLAAYQIISATEASSNMARYDGIRFGSTDEYGASEYGFDELITANRSKGFGPEVKRRIILGNGLLSADHGELRRKADLVRSQIKQRFRELFTRYHALISPTSADVAFPLGSRTEDQISMHGSDLLTVPASLAGIPAISIPCGLMDGLPVGLQIMGPDLSEDRLLKMAFAYEQAAQFPSLPFDAVGKRIAWEASEHDQL